jgi:hypothetical protein
MTRITQITESQIERLVSLILEQEENDWEHFSRLDYLHAFIKVFKNWIETKKQINFSDYPFSYLVNKYGREFAIEHKLIESGVEDDEYDEDEEVHYDARTLERWGQGLMKGGHIKYPSMREQGSFLSRFGNAIDRFISRQNYPDYMRVVIEEPKNFVLQPKIFLDLTEGLKSDIRKIFSKYDFNRDLEQYVQDILGIEIGSPVFGKVKILYPDVESNKAKFMKESVNFIKKEIKKLPNAEIIHSVRVELNDHPRMDLRLVFKGIPSYEIRRELREGTKAILEKLGYSTHKVTVNI